jgi:hypothetical protein
MYDDLVAELLTNPAARARYKADTGIDVDNVGRQRRRQQLIAQHESSRSRMQDFVRNGMMVTGSTNNAIVKPIHNRVDASVIHTYTPAYISDLHVGTTHTGRVLRGTSIVTPNFMGSVSTLLEDENGDVVNVSSSAHKRQPSGTHQRALRRVSSHTKP